MHIMFENCCSRCKTAKTNKQNTNKDSKTRFAAAAKSLQSCPTLWDPIDGSPPGSPVPEILQARTLEWVAISFSNAEKWKVKVKSLSRVRLLATPWTAAHQAPPSMGFSRQESWNGLPDFKKVQIKYSGMTAGWGDIREVAIAGENLLTAQNLQTKSRRCSTYPRAASCQNLGNNRKIQSWETASGPW